eukprot:TRINITY_DN4746_c1_g1_i3.p1 TRINITY_DN4746_c1_g1~~TRINITY_DN4746_c1_g1_i3.p1  ORF type:complete len:100 (-),score=12.84 TRINITY_DN4746_c1_g1_i3:130-429(-)
MIGNIMYFKKRQSVASEEHAKPSDNSMFGCPRYSTTDSESAEYNEVLAKLDKGRRSLQKLRCRNAMVPPISSCHLAVLGILRVQLSFQCISPDLHLFVV